MPYYHNECNGRVKWYPFLPIPPKCLECGKTWNPLVVYKAHVDDMTYIYEGLSLQIKRGTTSYAAWADSPSAPPGVAFIASNMPNWPRKWRLISFLGTIIFMSGAFFGLYLISFWAVIIGAIALAILPLIIVILVALIQMKRR